MCIEENFDYVTIEMILIEYKYLVSENSISLFVLMHWLVVACFCQKILAHNTAIAVKIDCRSSSTFLMNGWTMGKMHFYVASYSFPFKF